MTKSALELRGRCGRLADGADVHVWVEQGEGGIAVALLHEGSVIGRVTATRLAGRSAAELLAWTSGPWRRRGVATLAMADVIDWAQRRRVPYLHGDLPGGDADAAALGFLHASGLVTAIRSDANGRCFAALVPGVAAADIPLHTEVERSAMARVIAAVEGGASEPEASAMYHQLTASTARHPSAHAA